jgi:hypothetical protein
MDNEVLDEGQEALPDSDEQLDASTNEQQEQQKPEEPKVEAPPKYKLKANGKELELTLEELQKAAQKGIGAEEKMQAAAEMQKQIAGVLKLAKEDPRRFLSHPAIGADVKALVKSILQEEIEDAQLNDDQRKAKKLEAELNAIREEQQRQKQAEEAERMEKLTQHYQQELSTQIVSALETSGLPKTEQTVARIAQYMQAAVQSGIDDVTAADVLPYVKRDYELAIKSLLGVADETTLLSLLGDDITNKAVKAHLNKAKLKPAARPAGEPIVKAPQKPGAKKSLDLWRKEMEEKYGDLGASTDNDLE